MRSRISHRHTSVTNTTILNTRFHICRRHLHKQTGTIDLLSTANEVGFSEQIGNNGLVGAAWVAVIVGGIGAVVGAVDILTGEEFGAGAGGLGARDAVVGVAVCDVGVRCAGPRGADAADEEVAGIEAVDFVVCVHGFVGVGADEVETAGYVVRVVEDGFVGGTIVGGARGSCVGRGCGWSGHWWRWCCTSRSGCW